jgi:HlyD family secretion protein
MKKKHIVYLTILAGIGAYWYWMHHGKIPKNPFITTSLEKRTIKQQVHSVGILELKDTIKVGSLVAGTIAHIYASEHQKVTKGDLLAVIDNGKGNTEVKEAAALVARAQAQVIYQTKKIERARALLTTDHIALQDYEKQEQEFQLAKADLKLAAATLEKKEKEYQNLNIVAPIDGTIVSVGITEGMRITTDLDATVLFTIARDLSVMHGILEIDESDISGINTGQKVSLSIESYPYKVFTGKIIDVRYSPKNKSGILFYHATVEIDNSESLLRPGMTLQARIHVAKEKNIPTLPSTVFSFNKDKLATHATRAAQQLISLSDEEKKYIKKKYKNQNVQFVWLLHENQCKEVPVLLGITDDLYFGVLDGIAEHDAIICNIQRSTQKKQKTLFS